MAGGQVITSGQGSVTQSETVALVGSEIASATGFVGGTSLTGAESTTAAGTTAAGRLVQMRSRKVGGGSASRAIAGIASTPAVGSVLLSAASLLNSPTVSSAQGAFGRQRAILLNGAALFAQQQTIGPAQTGTFSILYTANEGTVNNGQRYGTADVTRGPVAYESAYSTKDGKIIEAFDGNHETIDPELGVVKSNRVGEFDPATGVMTEVFPSNWGANGVDGYDNLIYTYFDRIDSLVVFNNGVYDRTITNVNGSAWKYTSQGLPPAGRPPMYTETVGATAFAYFNPSQFRAGFNEHIAYFNAHCAYSKELDTAVIIGGASSGGPIDPGKIRLSIFVPSGIINPSIVAPYSVIYRGVSSAEGEGKASGRWAFFDEGRAGCCFLGNYVYWIGGEDPDIGTNPAGVKQRDLFRADVARIVYSSDPMTEPFVPEYLGLAPGNAFFKGALVADRYSNTLKLWHSGGVFLYDVTNNSWQTITTQLTEYNSTFGGSFYDFPHAAFIDTRNGVVKRKTYWWGGWTTGDFTNFDIKYSQVRSVKVTRNTQNWATRSTASGVLWAHDFSTNAEVEQFTFVGGMNGSNPNPATVANVIKRVAGIGPGGVGGMRTKLIGNTFTSPTPSGVAGDLHVVPVSAVSDWDDPAVVGEYKAMIGDPSDPLNPPKEPVAVVARNVGAGTLTIRRRTDFNGTTQFTYTEPYVVGSTTYNSPNCASFPAGWAIGMNQGGDWRRPLVPLAAGSNGRATADIGTTNGAMRAGAAYPWATGRDTQNHYFFRRGHYGSRYYWDTAVNPSAKWASQFVASDFTANAAQGNIFEGDEFYIQFRVRCSANLMTQHYTKVFYLHNTAIGGQAQIYMQAGSVKWGEVPYAPEVIPGVTYGNAVTLFTGGGDGRAMYGTHGYIYADRITQGPSGNWRWQTDYPATGDTPTAGSFCWPGDTWVTFMLHCKFGRDQSENMAVNTSPNSVPPPWPADTDPSYRTTVELFAHLPGWSDYKKLIGSYDFPWWFGDGLGNSNFFPYHPAGLNAFWMFPFSNLYIGSGGESPHPSTIVIDYAQAICSKKPIAPPSD